jgi:TRAP-type uncharacterized transport system fused permease subunit
VLAGSVLLLGGGAQPAATQYHRGIYVIITYVLVFLLYKSKTRSCGWSTTCCISIHLSRSATGFSISRRSTTAPVRKTLGQDVAVVGVLIGIELARRVVGNAFVIIGAVMILYGVYGPYARSVCPPGDDTFPNMCTTIYYMSDGVFGIMANVLATYVILFVLFGAFLEKPPAPSVFHRLSPGRRGA